MPASWSAHSGVDVRLVRPPGVRAAGERAQPSASPVVNLTYNTHNHPAIAMPTRSTLRRRPLAPRTPPALWLGLADELRQLSARRCSPASASQDSLPCDPVLTMYEGYWNGPADAPGIRPGRTLFTRGRWQVATDRPSAEFQADNGNVLALPNPAFVDFLSEAFSRTPLPPKTPRGSQLASEASRATCSRTSS